MVTLQAPNFHKFLQCGISRTLPLWTLGCAYKDHRSTKIRQHYGHCWSRNLLTQTITCTPASGRCVCFFIITPILLILSGAFVTVFLRSIRTRLELRHQLNSGLRHRFLLLIFFAKNNTFCIIINGFS